MDSLVDLYFFTPSLINATYDFHTFSSTGYVQIGEKWVKRDGVCASWLKVGKKDSVKTRADSP